MDFQVSPAVQAAAAARLLELERTEVFDAAFPGTRPNSYQSEILNEWGQVSSQYVVAGNRSGKSQLGARIAAWFLAENRPGWVRPAKWGSQPLVGMLVGRTMKQVEEELVRKIQAFFGPDELHIPRVGMIPQKIVHRKTGNTLLLASHHNEAEAREKLQAFTLQFIWLDEMPKTWRLFEELERRVSTSNGWFICTFTPKVKNQEIRKLIDAARLPYSKKYKMPMFANPSLDEDRKKKILQEMEVYPESYRRCVLEGDWLDDDSAVYHLPDNFIRMPEGYHSGWRHVESADPALQSKHGQVVYAEQPGTGHWYIVRDEYFQGIVVPEDLVKAVTGAVKHLNVCRRVCDSASTWFIGQASKMGFTYVTPWDKNNRRAEMMKSFQSKMGVSIFCAPWCTNLPQELTAMQWSETSADRVVNTHTYHLHDAAIYGADCLPKPIVEPVVHEHHVRIRMKQEQDRKADAAKAKGQAGPRALQPYRVGIRTRSWRR